MKLILLHLGFTTSMLFSVAQSKGAIITTGDWENGRVESEYPPAVLTITEDIHFHIQISGEVRFFVFDNWLPTDPGGTSTTQPVFDSYEVGYQINGGTIQLANIDGFFDSWFSVGEMTPRDGGFPFVAAVSVSAGDTLTIKARSFTMPGLLHPNGSTVPSPIPILFEGSAYVSTGEGVILGRVDNVPEPSAAVFCCLFGLVLLRRQAR